MRTDILEQKNKILQWVEENMPKSHMCQYFKCKPITLEKYLVKMNISYKGNIGLKGIKIPHNKKEIELYLQKGTTITSFKLKNKLIECGIKQKKCECCGLETWNNVDIPLELHHIDGDTYNNELTNIKLFCPNCHAQTSNYRTKNCIRTKSIRKEKKKRITKMHFCSCGKKIKIASKTCQACNILDKIKNRPSIDELIFQLKDSNYSEVGRKYKVTGKTIKNWLNQNLF